MLKKKKILGPAALTRYPSSGRQAEDPLACDLASLADLVNSWLSERPRLTTQGREKLWEAQCQPLASTHMCSTLHKHLDMCVLMTHGVSAFKTQLSKETRGTAAKALAFPLPHGFY